MYQINPDLCKKKLTAEEKKQIIDEIHSFGNIDGLVASILVSTRRNEIPANPKDLHNAFYLIKQKHPDSFAEFFFTRSGLYHFSKLLERIFFRLQNARIIRMINPGYDIFEITPESQSKVKEDFLSKYDPAKQKEIIEMAQEFLSAIP